MTPPTAGRAGPGSEICDQSGYVRFPCQTGAIHFRSARLRLEAITPSLASRILIREELPGDNWHPEYPFPDELGPLGGLAAAEPSDSVFTMYLIREEASGQAIGGLGFFGAPDNTGCVEIGYGLIAAVRGRGYATEAVRTALAFAKSHGAIRAKADTTEQNIPSRRVLEKAGFIREPSDAPDVHYVCELSPEISVRDLR